MWEHILRGELDEPTFLMPFGLRDVLGVTREQANETWFYVLGTFLFTLMWATLYKLSHFFSAAFFKTYRSLPVEKQAEWNSRIVSNINAILMTFEMFYFIPQHTDIQQTIIDPTMEHPPILVSFLMCRFTAYMIYDFLLMLVCAATCSQNLF
jgi:hypothetical protein